MDEWCARIIDTDRDSPPEVIEGQYQTMAPVHLFEIINTQFDIAKSTRCPKLILSVIRELASALTSYQRLLENLCKNRWRDLELEYIIALANNNSKCYDFTQELVEKVSKIVPEEDLMQVNMDPVMDGFHGVSKLALSALVEVVFADLEEALVKLFQKEWYDQDLIQLIINTMLDYYDNEVQNYLMDSYMRIFAQECLSRLVFRYISELLTRKHAFNQASVERMTDDIQAMRDFFTKYVRPNYLQQQTQVLDDLKELLDSESDMISLYYDSLLRHQGEVPLRVVEILLTQREGMDKSKVKEALASCKELKEKRPPVPDANAPKESLFSKIKLPTK